MANGAMVIEPGSLTQIKVAEQLGFSVWLTRGLLLRTGVVGQKLPCGHVLYTPQQQRYLRAVLDQEREGAVA